jgi:TolA-binding protein
MTVAWRITRRVAAGALALLLAAAPGNAAEESVADIREELTLLDRQIQEIREALVATGPASGLPQSPATALQRLDQLEAMLRRLTDRVAVLTNELGRVVDDASNRVGDIEFRLTELEGGDVSLLGSGEPLGGGLTAAAPPAVAPPAESGLGTGEGSTAGIGSGLGSGIDSPFVVPAPPVPVAPPAEAPQFAVGEQAQFDAARAAVEAGEYATAGRCSTSSW